MNEVVDLSPTDQLTEALSKAQGEMHNAPLNRTNPHYKSKYADLASIRDATIPALSKHGLSIRQYTKIVDGEIRLYTVLSHSSGQTETAEFPIMGQKIQDIGSWMTYARRYCWAAMCGISAEDDDDGNQAKTTTRQTKARTGELKPEDVQREAENLDRQYADTVGPDPQAPLYHIEPPGSDASEDDWTVWCVEVDKLIKVAASGGQLKAIYRDNKQAWERCSEAKRERLTKAAADRKAALEEQRTAA